MRPRIFVTQPVADSALKRLRKVAAVKVNPDASRMMPKRELVAAARACDILFGRLRRGRSRRARRQRQAARAQLDDDHAGQHRRRAAASGFP